MTRGAEVTATSFEDVKGATGQEIAVEGKGREGGEGRTGLTDSQHCRSPEVGTMTDDRR